MLLLWPFLLRHGLRPGPSTSSMLGGEGNIGMMKPFEYSLKMRQIYGLCLQSLKPGGYLALIIKDYYSGQLHELGWRSWQTLLRVGFEHQDWFRWMPPGTQFKADHRKLGHRVVEDEHIIIVRRPLNEV